jgi:hypothetical protein
MPVKSARKPVQKSAAPRRSPASGRILTTHVGSLARPLRLREFLAAQRDGRPYDEAAFETCLHDSVAEVVRKQAEIGLNIVNDGEYGKTISWSRYVLQRLSGFEQRGQREAGMPAAVVGRDRREFAEFYAAYDRTQGFSGMSGWVLSGPIRHTGHADSGLCRPDPRRSGTGDDRVRANRAGRFTHRCRLPRASRAPDRRR